MDKSVIVSLKDIVMNYDDEQVLKGINLDIHDKEFITFLGPSGCGKTTTLRRTGLLRRETDKQCASFQKTG